MKSSENFLMFSGESKGNIGEKRVKAVLMLLKITRKEKY